MHRLLCGDSTDPESFRRLVGRRKVHLVFSGPPYFNQRPYARWHTYDSYIEDMKTIIRHCTSRLEAGGLVAWQIGRGAKERRDHIGHLSVLLNEQQLYYQDAIAWVKPSANYTVKRSCHILRNGFYYPAFRWEVILIYRKPGRMTRMSSSDREYMSRYHTDVWEIPWVTRQMKRYGHPSVAPLEIPLRCLRAYSKRGNNVLDPFAGSGTTLIAAEETGRKCLAIERRPAYCKTIIKRWERVTGKKAHRL